MNDNHLRKLYKSKRVQKWLIWGAIGAAVFGTVSYILEGQYFTAIWPALVIYYAWLSVDMNRAYQNLIYLLVNGGRIEIKLKDGWG